MEQAVAALLTSQAELQRAVRELCEKVTRDATISRSPGACLTKLTLTDDIEAYLVLFERTATREGWPPAEWAGILAPFLSGEAQRACRDLSAADAMIYAKVKTAILTRQGFSLPARAQRYHAWVYNSGQPPRPQVAALLRSAQSWLQEGPETETPWIERLVIDRIVRALPPDAKRYASRVSPTKLDGLVSLLENHQVSEEMLKPTRPDNRLVTTDERPG